MESLIDRAERLHSAPQVAASLMRLTADENYDAQAVVECLESDPALTVQLLRIVNSSRYGLPNRVSNLRQAVMLVGRRTLRLTVLTFSIIDTFTRGVSRQLYENYWRRSLTIANAAAKLTKQATESDANDAYTAGLLADLGVLLLAQAKPDEYAALQQGSRHGSELVLGERKAFGFDHAQLSACLLERWKFPEPLVRAVSLHHDDDRHDALTRTVRGGSIMAEVLWDEPADDAAAACLWLETTCGVNLDGLIDLAISCKDDVVMELDIYGAQLSCEIDYAALVEKARRRYHDVSIQAAMDMDSVIAVMDEPSAYPSSDLASRPNPRLST